MIELSEAEAAFFRAAIGAAKKLAMQYHKNGKQLYPTFEYEALLAAYGGYLESIGGKCAGHAYDHFDAKRAA